MDAVTFDRAENRYEFNVLYVDRRRWIRRRNALEAALRRVGIPRERSCAVANRILDRLGYRSPRIVSDRLPTSAKWWWLSGAIEGNA